jgi:hypothetical protein
MISNIEALCKLLRPPTSDFHPFFRPVTQLPLPLENLSLSSFCAAQGPTGGAAASCESDAPVFRFWF